MYAEKNDRSLFPCGKVNRRDFLFQFGLYGSAMGALWAADAKMPAGIQGRPRTAKSGHLL